MTKPLNGRFSLRVLACAAIAIAGTNPCNAQVTITRDAKGCGVQNAFPRANETITWSGHCKNGLTEGHGILQWSLDGVPAQRYEGEFKDGLVQGFGTEYFPNGDKYVGNFVDGHRSGRGTYSLANGSRLEGFFQDTVNGPGTLFYSNGDKYVGDFVRSKRSGHGTLTHADGTIEEMDFLDGVLQKSTSSPSPNTKQANTGGGLDSNDTVYVYCWGGASGFPPVYVTAIFSVPYSWDNWNGVPKNEYEADFKRWVQGRVNPNTRDHVNVLCFGRPNRLDDETFQKSTLQNGPTESVDYIPSP